MYAAHVLQKFCVPLANVDVFQLIWPVQNCHCQGSSVCKNEQTKSVEKADNDD